MIRKIISLVIIFGFWGCATAPKPIQKETSQSTQALPPDNFRLNKTFGDISFSGISTMLIQYKDISILIDPQTSAIHESIEGMKRSKTSTLAMEKIPFLDYLILTDAEPLHFGGQVKSMVRSDIKIISPLDSVSTLASLGFKNVKSLEKGQKIMLKKGNNFLFVSAYPSKNPITGKTVSSYVLEFDNGRNILISGNVLSVDPLRECLYGLRDEGKEIQMAFIYSGSLPFKSGNETKVQSFDEKGAADLIGLFQPTMAVVVQTDSLEEARFDKSVFSQALKDQIYDGHTAVASPSDSFPF